MKKALLTLLILGLLGAGAWFGRNYYLPYLLPGSNEEVLRIVMNIPETDLSPYGLNLNNATRIRNVFEPLVSFDRNLKIIPSLALTWGNLDDSTWEFQLRKGVTFHDGSPFTSQSVVDSFKAAKSSGNALIKPYIEGIVDIKATATDRVEVNTEAPDPLLLSKLTKLFIHKNGAIGTGPYTIDELVRGDHLTLEAYPDYWGRIPTFSRVRYEVVESRPERAQAFRKGGIDILVGVSEELALELPERQIKTNYGLEVNFLMFKLDDEVFQDKAMRQQIQSLFDPDRLEAIGNHFVRYSSQFIAPGVFGYNQGIPAYSYSPKNEARDLFGNRLQPVTLDYLSSFKTLAEYIATQLRQAGFSVDAQALEPEALLQKIENNESQIFLTGWRAADGDAGGFFNAFVHSDGEFNQGRYKNGEIDQLIAASRTEMEPSKRLSMLQQIGELLSEDIIGIPLFETSRLYAINEGIQWEPRLDGEVLASEISK